MGIYYFAVDYSTKQQMWSPKHWSDKCIYYPRHPLPCMIAMKNCQGYNFKIVNDASTYEEHEFENVTEKVYEEFKNEFKDYDWQSFEKQ